MGLSRTTSNASNVMQISKVNFNKCWLLKHFTPHLSTISKMDSITHQFWNELLVAHQYMETLAAVLNTGLQYSQRVHHHRVVLSRTLSQPLPDSFYSIFRAICCAVYNVTYFHVKGPVFWWECAICSLFWNVMRVSCLIS